MKKPTFSSKVAGSPRDLRERISQMLLAGKCPEEVAATLARENAVERAEPANPANGSDGSDPLTRADGGDPLPAPITFLPALTPEDIAAWQKTGHEDWLEERKQLTELEHIRELARGVLKSGDGAVIQEASLQIVAARLYELLNWFNPKAFKKKTQQNLADYARLVNALIKLSDGGLKFERYRAQVAEGKAEMEKALKKENDKPGLSAEAREIIERELKLL